MEKGNEKEIESPAVLAGRVIDDLRDRVNKLEIDNQRYKDGLNKCRVFKEEVSKMLDYQQAYFKSGKNKRDLIISMNQEKKVREMINPPKTPVKTLFDEAL